MAAKAVAFTEALEWQRLCKTSNQKCKGSSTRNEQSWFQSFR